MPQNPTSDRLAYFWIAYGLLGIVVVPMFVGVVGRGEMSLYVWKEFGRALSQHGWSSAFGVAILQCVLIYSYFLVVPYQVIVFLYRSMPKASVRGSAVLVAFWFFFTLLYVGEAPFRSKNVRKSIQTTGS